MIPVCKELIISRIGGLNYPISSDKEDYLLQNYFHEKKLIEKSRNITIIAKNQFTADNLWENSTCLGLYIYKVISLIDELKGDVTVGEVYKDKTKIILRNHLSCTYVPVVSLYLNCLQSCEENPIQFTPFSVNLPVPEFHCLSKRLVMSCDNENSVKDELQVVREGTLHQFQEIWAKFAELSPIFPALNAILSNKFRNFARSNVFSILVKNEATSVESVYQHLSDCCRGIGVPLFQIESRMITFDQSKLKLLNLYKSGSNININLNYLHSLQAEEIISFSPCVIFLKDLDEIINKSSSKQHSPSSSESTHETPEELFAKNLSLVFEQLTQSLLGKNDSIGNIIFVASSNHCTKLSSSLTSLFHITIPFQRNLGPEFPDISSSISSLSVIREFQNQFPQFSDNFISSVHGNLLREKRNETMKRTPPKDSRESKYIDKTLKKLILASENLKLSEEKFASSSSKISPVHWEDIGGLEHVRKELLDVLELPYKFPEFFPPNAPRRMGILLYGPPGTGKTLVAKAVATECKMSFLSIKGPELLDSYVGESEKNIRELFRSAIEQSPCVMFFDEIDSIAPARSKGNDSGGGVMDRMVSQFLTEIDQLRDGDKKVFIIAATNRPDLLDSALLRPGRFDRRIYLGVSKKKETKLQILQSQLRKYSLASNICYDDIIDRFPDYVTGADVSSVTNQAFQIAFARKLQELNQQFHEMYKQQQQRQDQEQLDQIQSASILLHDSVEDKEKEYFLLLQNPSYSHQLQKFINSLPISSLQIEISQQDLFDSLAQLRPTAINLSHYEELQKKFENI